MGDRSLITQRIDGSARAIEALRDHVDRIASAGELLINRLQDGGTLYTAGNGGSAAHALHLAEELIGRYRGDRRPLRALCLNADPSTMTCIANDYGYAQVFARQCEALLNEGDVLLVLSTSGESENIIEALQVARKRGATTIGLLGGSGGRCAALCDHAITVDGRDSAHIQDAHQVIVHLFCELVERAVTR